MPACLPACLPAFCRPPPPALPALPGQHKLNTSAVTGRGTRAARVSFTFRVSFAVSKARLATDTAATTDGGAGQAAPEAALQ